MLEIVDRNIRITRGDKLPITVSAANEVDGNDYQFQNGDIIRFTIMQANKVRNVLLQKDFKIDEVCLEKQIEITAPEMKIGELIDKPKDYWYEIEVNPGTNNTMTIEGYRKDEGPAILTLLPEGGDNTSEEAK